MKPDYSVLDQPEVLAVIFHPRPESSAPVAVSQMSDHLIPVAEDVHVGARFFALHATGPNLLFFHGNGEIVAEYDELGPLYNNMGINFMAADYRGYGRSSGQPSVSAMMADCHKIYDYLRTWLAQNSFDGPLVVMGRSLGSASALELAASYVDQIAGLIIESGFAHASALLQLLGVDTARLGFHEAAGFMNLDKIGRFSGPTLIIHAELDHIIPYSDGEDLYHACAGRQKQLLKIEGANHNDILMRGFSQYMQSIQSLMKNIDSA